MIQKVKKAKSAAGFVVGTVGSSYYVPEDSQDLVADKLGVSSKLLVDSSAALGFIWSSVRLKGADLGQLVSEAAANTEHYTAETASSIAALGLLAWGIYGLADNTHRVYMNHKNDRQLPGTHMRIAYALPSKVRAIKSNVAEGFEEYMNAFNVQH